MPVPFRSEIQSVYSEIVPKTDRKMVSNHLAVAIFHAGNEPSWHYRSIGMLHRFPWTGIPSISFKIHLFLSVHQRDEQSMPMLVEIPERMVSVRKLGFVFVAQLVYLILDFRNFIHIHQKRIGLTIRTCVHGIVTSDRFRYGKISFGIFEHLLQVVFRPDVHAIVTSYLRHRIRDKG